MKSIDIVKIMMNRRIAHSVPNFNFNMTKEIKGISLFKYRASQTYTIIA